jgi:spermidine synthase
VHPLLVYAGIETAIAVLGLLELLVIPLVSGLYLAGPASGLAGMLLRGAVAAICLLPPAILMGASLPAIVRWVEAGPRGVSWWGALYGANTAGAVFGCLFAGFYLLRLYDVDVATFVAAAINLSVALLSVLFAMWAPRRSLPDRDNKDDAPVKPVRLTIHAAIALSGATALGAEVVWTRLMGLTFGATVYAFSIILAVFLSGLALGTALASALLRGRDARLALGWCQFGSAFGIAWAAWMIAAWFPYWPVNPALAAGPAAVFEFDLVRSVWAIAPATIFWGASFPFAFAAASGAADAGRTVGHIYAANTLGAIAGALIVSLILIPAIGTQNTQRVLLVLAAASGFLMLLPFIRERRSLALEMGAGFALGFAVLMTLSLPAVPGELIAYGRRIATTMGEADVLYAAEGRNTSIAVTRWKADGAIQFHVAGKVEASTESYDMRLQRMLGALPALIHGDPKSVLIVGFGGGVTAGSFTRYPGVSRIVICELEPLIPPASTRYFAAQNYHVMSDPRTRIVYDDARHYVAATAETFDIITSDPIHPFVKGSAALYSKEYFEAVKAHLNPGGIVSQWVPLYESDAETVKSEIATFAAVFPHVTLWANLNEGKGYDMVLVGQVDAPKIDLDAIDARLARPDYGPARQSLADVQLADDALFLTYAGDAAGLAPWLKDGAINRDKDLRLQYLAGLALNRSEQDAIYRQIRRYWTKPLGLFAGSETRKDAFYTRMSEALPSGE